MEKLLLLQIDATLPSSLPPRAVTPSLRPKARTLTFLCFLAIHLSQLLSMSSHLDSLCLSTSRGTSSSLWSRGQGLSEVPREAKALAKAPATSLVGLHSSPCPPSLQFPLELLTHGHPNTDARECSPLPGRHRLERH